jgi:hypothetical protein
MRKLIRLLTFIFSFVILNSIFVIPAKAICPVCTVAVAAGLGLSRYLGIDDTVSGVWVGGLILSSSFWLIDWLERKKFQKLTPYYNFRYRVWLVTILMYAIFLIPLWTGGIIGHPFNTLFGIDKLVLGTAAGSGIFLLALYADRKVRELKGKQLFSFQKVVFPVFGLLLISLILFLITSVKIGFR